MSPSPHTSTLSSPRASFAPSHEHGVYGLNVCDAAGFETVTYVLPGKKGLVHRDSLGCKMSYGEGEAMHGLRKGWTKVEVWAEGEWGREARGE